MKSQYTMGLTLLAGIAIGALAMQGLYAQTKLKAYSVGEIEPIAGATLSPSYLDNIRKEINKSHGRSLRTLNGKIFHIEGAPAPTKIAIVEWDSADNARAFLDNPELKAAMEEAGVVEAPEAYILEEYDRGTM